jgi:hypothetical protein
MPRQQFTSEHALLLLHELLLGGVTHVHKVPVREGVDIVAYLMNHKSAATPTKQ